MFGLGLGGTARAGLALVHGKAVRVAHLELEHAVHVVAQLPPEAEALAPLRAERLLDDRGLRPVQLLAAPPGRHGECQGTPPRPGGAFRTTSGDPAAA